MGVQRVRSPMPPWTITSLGPAPVHSTAMDVPSFDGTRIIWLSRPGGGPCEGLAPLGRELEQPPRCEATTPKTTKGTANAINENDTLKAPILANTNANARIRFRFIFSNHLAPGC